MNAHIWFDALCLLALFGMTAIGMRTAGRSRKERAWLWAGLVLILLAVGDYLLRP